MHKEIILFICGAQRDYVRSQQILQALKVYFDVIEVTSNKSSYLLRIPEVFLGFLWISLFRRYSLIYAGFFGQPLVLFIRLFNRVPIVMDAFLSIYDTLCLDRKDFKPNSFIGKVSFWVDKISLDWSERVITDTNTHADYFSNLFNIKRSKFYTVYVGADEDIFYPREINKKKEGKFIVFFHGTFLPLHGIEYIVKAAKVLDKGEDILFILLGGGREKSKILKLSEDLGVRNIEFVDWISYGDLAGHICMADICLGGHFSDIDKAKRVIAGKVALYLSMKRPVIIGDNSATHEIFTHRENVYICKMADEYALAEAVLELRNDKDLRDKIAGGGFSLFQSRCSKYENAEKLKLIIEGALSR